MTERGPLRERVAVGDPILSIRFIVMPRIVPFGDPSLEDWRQKFLTSWIRKTAMSSRIEEIYGN